MFFAKKSGEKREILVKKNEFYLIKITRKISRSSKLFNQRIFLENAIFNHFKTHKNRTFLEILKTL